MTSPQAKRGGLLTSRSEDPCEPLYSTVLLLHGLPRLAGRHSRAVMTETCLEPLSVTGSAIGGAAGASLTRLSGNAASKLWCRRRWNGRAVAAKEKRAVRCCRLQDFTSMEQETLPPSCFVSPLSLLAVSRKDCKAVNARIWQACSLPVCKKTRPCPHM